MKMCWGKKFYFEKVDFNVTRHLDFELAQNDWHLMVLHYLGLDHVGHIEGLL